MQKDLVRFQKNRKGGGSERSKRRLRMSVRGLVQGVGFRPFVHQLAEELNLSGWIRNTLQGVRIEVEGPDSALKDFLFRLEKEKPVHSFIQSLESSYLDPKGYKSFEIRKSKASGDPAAIIMPDIATCRDCLEEIFDRKNRRHRYPFTNCTHCGPRFSILQDLPYDRANTSMKDFTMCPACREEYEGPLNRRYHAQPNACPQCGPQMALWDGQGNLLTSGDDALLKTADALRGGKIVAVKGLGGFHLMADATQEEVVRRLRYRKHREEKPFAVMFAHIREVRKVAKVSDLEARVLMSPEAPIVLLRKRHLGGSKRIGSGVAEAVAPGNPYWGILLPSTPLHHLLLNDAQVPLVASSGNLSNEPIVKDENEALERLGGIADLFLVHNRPIVRHVDDSIVKIIGGREAVMRRARGFAPLPLTFPAEVGEAISLGAHMKNSIAVASGHDVFVGQHIGDLDSFQAFKVFKQNVADLEKLYRLKKPVVLCDKHPDYASTRFAFERVPQPIQVQHHLAHVFACAAENEITPPFLGIAWDGTGYGLDGSVWGGEFFRATSSEVVRLASLTPFSLPGLEHAVREPKRSAVGILFEMMGEDVFDRQDISLIRNLTDFEASNYKIMLTHQTGVCRTSSMGRLFDAVSALAGICTRASYEGQAAMLLEYSALLHSSDKHYPFDLKAAVPPNGDSLKGCQYHIDWKKVIEAVLVDLQGSEPETIAAKFHNTLAEMILEMARLSGESKVVLSGGCFQNQYLTEKIIQRLREENFKVYWHQRIPPNDGGIAFGQIAYMMSERSR